MTVRELRRSLGGFVAITRGRVTGRTYVPHPRQAIFIETTARCNLACRFCAYAKQPPGGFMEDALYRDVVGQVTALGFSHIWLTPMLGDVFTDPRIMQRFALLEKTNGLSSYSFYTNFIMARTEQIEALPKLAKLRSICISIYGLDPESFTLTTRKPASQFDKLLDNLETLFAVSATWRPSEGISFSIRTARSGIPPLERATPLAHMLRTFVEQRGASISVADDYDNWGGTITREDVAPLGLDLVDGRRLHMHGACVKVFSEVQILADGRVHACACRDVDGSLMIGDVRKDPLAHILSLDNPRYRAIIEAQMRGSFADNCRACSHYRSVFDDRAARADATMNTMSYAAACRTLSAPTPPAG